MKNLLLLCLLFVGCGEIPLSALRSVEAEYPNCRIVQAEKGADFNMATSQWVVFKQDGTIVLVWCSDSGEIHRSQEIPADESKNE